MHIAMVRRSRFRQRGEIERCESHPLAAHRKNIQAVQAAWVKPAQALEAAIVKRAVAESALNEAKQAWLDGYDALRGALQKEFPRRRVFVRSFFPKRAKKKASAKPLSRRR